MVNQLDQDFLKLTNIINLNDRLSINRQANLIKNIGARDLQGLQKLFDLLIERRKINDNQLSYIDGILIQELYFSQVSHICDKLYKYFYLNVVQTNTVIDYTALEQSLVMRNFEKADQLTQISLCNLASSNLSIDNQRSWLYFTDILSLPVEDLRIIDTLWKIYSQEKFGFSIQRDIWLTNNCNWDKLWCNIGWKKQNSLIRYPQEFVWNTSAPLGHLPLFNQLRGVQVLSVLFQHSAWTLSSSS